MPHISESKQTQKIFFATICAAIAPLLGKDERPPGETPDEMLNLGKKISDQFQGTITQEGDHLLVKADVGEQPYTVNYTRFHTLVLRALENLGNTSREVRQWFSNKFYDLFWTSELTGAT